MAKVTCKVCEKCGCPLAWQGLGRFFHNCPTPQLPEIEHLSTKALPLRDVDIAAKLNELTDAVNRLRKQ